MPGSTLLWALLLMKFICYQEKNILFSSLSLREKEAVDLKLVHTVQQGLIIWGLSEALAFRSI